MDNNFNISVTQKHWDLTNCSKNDVWQVVFQFLDSEKFQVRIKEQKIIPNTHKETVIVVVDYILHVALTVNNNFRCKNGKGYFYNGAYWIAETADNLKLFLGEASERLGLDPLKTKHYSFRNELYKQFMSAAFLYQKDQDHSDVIINLMNGTFVFNEAKQYLRPFDANDFLTYQLPFGYDKNATAPVFKKYLDDVLPEKQSQQILAEYLGYIFIRPNILKLEKVLILYGTGANGKSVFFDIVNALLGVENISHYSLASLTNHTGYERAKIADKLLNYASELSPKMEKDYFKQLVSGEPIEARLPYGEPFSISNYAKFIFNTNSLTKDVEPNEAFFRRNLVIKFDITIPESKRNPNLARNIINSELPGVFNWILEGLKRLLEQRRFTESPTVENTLKEYRIHSDNVLSFLDENMYSHDLNEKKQIQKLYSDYKDFCQISGLHACSRNRLSERLSELGYKKGRSNKGVFFYMTQKPGVEG